MSTKILTLAEAAERLRKTPAQMRWMRYNGTGPRSAKLGGRIVYREKDLEDWIEEAFRADEVTA
ncbi:helix-turn-helix transcriptional regulator [Arsenicicoccus dermatophilus]|uniref:helix-turn-helix transcriptional regulator n=1 Tax=Arsenicicoccus dermatophilus TaxID=1076331 RepID=UPI001F4D108A|nr:helix-turn-helix domain-containing protein [Arsenicicoccus dermatophilus]MCH8611785.1 helix-turn-helix domain-containing protein [Arsenicicoccus dermatophilus]